MQRRSLLRAESLEILISFGMEKYILVHSMAFSKQPGKWTTATWNKKDESQKHNKLNDKHQLSMSDALLFYLFKVQNP